MISDLIKSEIQEFIQDHLYDDPALLMLKAASYSQIPMRLAVEQIQSKRKAKAKLPEWFNTIGIIYPPVLSLEQCSSEVTAIYKASLVEGKSMADLTGGMGIDTYYLAKSFEQAHYIERQANLVEIALHNFNQLGAKHIQTHNNEAEAFLESVDEELDLIYLDPARRGAHNSKVVRFEDCEPNVISLLPELQPKAKSILVKASPMLDIKGAIQDLGEVTAVYVIADKNEVKELLFLIDKDASINPTIHAVNCTTQSRGELVFDYESESSVSLQFGTVVDYLYEPNAAVLKAGAFKSIVSQYPSLIKLHANTHLYTSDQPIENFPGRSFKIIDFLQMNKKQLRKKLPDMKANITVRNFPMTVDQIRKKTGLKEGGDQYIFATQSVNGPMVLLCKKL